MHISRTINGSDELLGRLKKLATTDDVRTAVASNTRDMNRKQIRRAPVDTGYLKRSIIIEFNDNGFTGHSISTASYSGYLEHGTRFMHKQPYFWPVFDLQTKQFKKDMGRLFENK